MTQNSNILALLSEIYDDESLSADVRLAAARAALAIRAGHAEKAKKVRQVPRYDPNNPPEIITEEL